ncbi:MAG: phosphate signaling complex protein PhoU [Bacteroidetes bacterium]|nr:phosphate signaling complex protein PhoU [Bacteroidota bacterium]
MDTVVRNTEHLRRKLLRLCAMVEENARRAVLAFRSRDRYAAVEIIKADEDVNLMEIAIEENCISLLNAASRDVEDTRLIVAALRINSDLERIGDLATNIARRVLHMGQSEQVLIPQELSTLANRTLEMLSNALDAFVDLDTEMAQRVCERDQEVDRLNRQMYDLVQERILADPAQTEKLISYLSVSRYLERIADYATNIAENVVFISEGNIIRHRNGDVFPPAP